MKLSVSTPYTNTPNSYYIVTLRTFFPPYVDAALQVSQSTLLRRKFVRRRSTLLFREFTSLHPVKEMHWISYATSEANNFTYIYLSHSVMHLNQSSSCSVESLLRMELAS